MNRPTRRQHRSDVDRDRPTLRRSALVRSSALGAVTAVAVTLAACGSSSSASTTSTARPAAKGSAGAGGSGPGSGGRRFPGVSGTIAAINGATLEVQDPVTGQTTVTYTSATAFEQTVPASAGAVTVGTCITAVGAPTSGSGSTKRFGGPVTATRVMVSQPASGSCSAGPGGLFRPGGPGAPSAGAPGSGGPPSGPSGGGAPGATPAGPGTGRPAGRAPGQFSAASGLVAAVSGSQVTVDETNPATNATSTAVVTLTGSTVFTQRTTASPADLTVGKCAQAVGTADTTGAVAATSITVSTPGANGCSGRFGRFGGGGEGAAGAGGAGGGAASA